MEELRRNIFVLLTLAIFCGAFIQSASAQTSRGTVQGTLKDPNGGVVPGGMVTLTNTETNVSRYTTSNAQGFYRFDAVDPGTYKLAFTAPGFGRLDRTDITVSANQ